MSQLMVILSRSAEGCETGTLANWDFPNVRCDELWVGANSINLSALSLLWLLHISTEMRVSLASG